MTTHNYTGYAHGCRCDTCTSAWRVQAALMRKSRAVRLALGLANPAHGRHSTYTNWGCRCGSCTEAASLAWANRGRGRRR